MADLIQKSREEFIESHDELKTFIDRLMLIERTLSDGGFRSFYLASLISADVILSLKDAEFALEQLTFIKNNLKYLNLYDDVKESCAKHIEKGIEIININIKDFKREGNGKI